VKRRNDPLTIADQVESLGMTISDLVHAQAHLMVAYNLLNKHLGKQPPPLPGQAVDLKCQYCGGKDDEH